MITRLEDGTLKDGDTFIGVNGPRYKALIDQEKRGSITIEAAIKDIEQLRAEVIEGVRVEAIRRIALVVNVAPELDMTQACIAIYAHAWPQTNPSQYLIEGKAIYDFALTRLSQARRADRQTLEAYDVKGDAWP